VVLTTLRECLRVIGGKWLRFGGYLVLIVEVGFLSVKSDICDWVMMMRIGEGVRFDEYIMGVEMS